MISSTIINDQVIEKLPEQGICGKSEDYKTLKQTKLLMLI